jgi:hypothetical protein
MASYGRDLPVIDEGVYHLNSFRDSPLFLQDQFELIAKISDAQIGLLSDVCRILSDGD